MIHLSNERKVTRKPQQKRSKLMTEKILAAALELFCNKGYYNTTTNEIAKEAGISIGSLYSYFKDKDTIFIEILGQYHDTFLSVFENIKREVSRSLYEQDKKAWLRILLDHLIQLHMSVKTLNRELKALYYIKNEVRAVMDKQTKKIRMETLGILLKSREDVRPDNLEITSLLIVDFMSAIVDRIVFDEGLTQEEKEDIISMGIDAVFKILYQ